MSADVEDLLREGMERFTEGVRAPAGLAYRASRQRRRRRIHLVRGAVLIGTVAATATVIAVAMTAAGTVARPGSSLAQARAAAYVVGRVKTALASEHNVFVGSTMSTGDQPSVTWAYGAHNRFEEFTGTQCGQVNASGDCSHQGGSQRYLAAGTALVNGKLTGAYVTYFDHKYSLSPVYNTPASACGQAALGMGGPPVPTAHWSSFIKATLDCGAATVTGQVRINGQEVIRITGKPITVRLSPRYGKTVHEHYARALWTLFVNPSSYLPVRMIGVTETFGGTGGQTRFESVTNVQWLPPTTANVAQALVTIPPGYHRVSSAADQ
jgi:hypothetical protein